MLVSISQPGYLSWLGYFDRIARSDIHVILDDVQIEHNSSSVVNRNKIRQKEGWSWLTVPILTKGRHNDQLIRDVEIDGTRNWQLKHWQSIIYSYGRAPYFSQYRDELAAIYALPVSRLVDIIDPLRQFLLRALAISTPLLRSSDLDVSGVKSDLILNICRHLGTETYLSGPFGRDYLDLNSFAAAGIAVEWHDYDHPVYKQTFPGFEPYMSALDLVLNHGPDAGTIVRMLGRS